MKNKRKNAQKCVFSLYCAGGELDYKVGIVRLNLCFVCRLVPHGFTALFTSVNDNISALGIRKGTDRAQNSSALVCSVAGIYINVQGAKTERAVVS